MGSPKSVKAVSFTVSALCLLAQLSVIDAVIHIRKPNYPKDPPPTVENISKLGVYGQRIADVSQTFEFALSGLPAKHGIHPETTIRSNKNGREILKAAVAANGPECAEIGKNILAENGSAVDAAIATLLCDGVVSVHSMGIGGGFLMTIWDAQNKTAECINAREAAPGAANADMFENAAQAKFGGRSIAVPGEIAGYWKAHSKYGRLPWKKLFKPTIDICKRGSKVNKYIADTLREVQSYILEQPSMREILIDPDTNQTWAEGKRIKRPALAKTLMKIAESTDPIGLFYHGDMAEEMVREIQGMGGIMQLSDFQSYKAKVVDPISVELNGKTLYTVPPPGSGVILGFMMQILDELLPTDDMGVFWQRLVETFKWAYARRSEFGDLDKDVLKKLIDNISNPEYVKYVRNAIRDDWTSNSTTWYGAELEPPNDAGTANVCVLAADGSAVTVTSTINHYLGSMRRSPSTGIIFNDEMDDFSSAKFINGFAMPASTANKIAPFKRPMSSMAPSILIDNSRDSVRMLVGSAGGTKITTAIATTMALHLYAGFNVREAIDTRRIHHQLFPMVVDYEEGANPDMLEHLRKIGHEVTSLPRMGSTVTAITVEHIADDRQIIKASADGRREGNVAGY